MIAAASHVRPWSRAALRRQLVLTPEGHRAALRPLLIEAQGGALPDGLDRLGAYLCDPIARAIAVPREVGELAVWLAGPLFAPIAADQVAPIADDAAAIVCAALFVNDDAMSAALHRWRFSPRTDPLIAAVVSVLPADVCAAEIERLACTAGPDEARLHLALLQAGRALASSPQVWDRPIAGELVERLLALLVEASPAPLLHDIARSLGSIACVPGALGTHVREQAARRLREAISGLRAPRPQATFLDEVRDLSRERRVPDLDHWAGLPRRQLARACARLCGCAAPHEVAAFADYQGEILAELPDLVFEAFVEGLIAAAATAPLEALFEALCDDSADDHGGALELAARYPIDRAAAALLAGLEAEDPGVRALAVAGVAWLDSDVARDALTALLADPDPDVVARAGRALVECGEGGRVQAALAREEALGGATLALIGGDLSTCAISTLVTFVLEVTEHDPGGLDHTTALATLAAGLFGSSHGLATCAHLIAGAPEALPVIALAAAHEVDDLDCGIAIPAEGGRELARELIALAQHGDDREAHALLVLARLCCGDRSLVDPLVTALDRSDGHGHEIVAAIAALRVRDPAFARALAPLLANREHLAARILAAAAAGRALPGDDPAWLYVGELLELGALASAAAWSALRDRARFGDVAP